MLRKTLQAKRDEVTGEWRLHSEELYSLFLLSIIRMIKLRRMSWDGHVARTGRREVHTGFQWRDLREGDDLEILRVDGRIILR